MIQYYLAIYVVTIVSMSILHILLIRKILNKVKEFEKYKEETDRKLEVLVKVSHLHDQFIEGIKKRSEELIIKNRRGGVR